MLLVVISLKSSSGILIKFRYHNPLIKCNLNISFVLVLKFSTDSRFHSCDFTKQIETTEKRFRDYVNLRCVLLNPGFLTKNMEQKWQLSNFLAFKNNYIFFLYAFTNFTFQNVISHFYTIIKLICSSNALDFLLKQLSSRHTLFPKSNILP